MTDAQETSPADDAGATATESAESAAVVALRARFGDAIGEAAENRGQWRVIVDREVLRDATALLRDEPSLRYDFPVDVTALDHFPDEPRFRVIYVLRSMTLRLEIVLKVIVPEDDCWAPTLSDVYPAFDKIEREAYDMFGIDFRDHVDLRRIMMPEMYEHYPLRKDFPMEGKMSDKEWAQWIIARAQRLEGNDA